MKNMVRATGLILGLVVVLFATGCAKKKESASAVPTRKPITISVFTIQPRQQPNPDNKAYKYLKEKLGVTFEWDILVGELAQKRGVMIAGEDYPDV